MLPRNLLKFFLGIAKLLSVFTYIADRRHFYEDLPICCNYPRYLFVMPCVLQTSGIFSSQVCHLFRCGLMNTKSSLASNSVVCASSNSPSHKKCEMWGRRLMHDRLRNAGCLTCMHYTSQFFWIPAALLQPALQRTVKVCSWKSLPCK